MVWPVGVAHDHIERVAGYIRRRPRVAVAAPVVHHDDPISIFDRIHHPEFAFAPFRALPMSNQLSLRRVKPLTSRRADIVISRLIWNLPLKRFVQERVSSRLQQTTKGDSVCRLAAVPSESLGVYPSQGGAKDANTVMVELSAVGLQETPRSKIALARGVFCSFLDNVWDGVTSWVYMAEKVVARLRCFLDSSGDVSCTGE